MGIEKDPAHYATAVERITRELAQGDLFLSPNKGYHKLQPIRSTYTMTFEPPYFIACPVTARESYIEALASAKAWRTASRMFMENFSPRKGREVEYTTARMLMRSEAKLAISSLNRYRKTLE